MMKKRIKRLFAKIIAVAAFTAFSGIAFASASNASIKETEQVDIMTETIAVSSVNAVEEIPESSAFTPEGNMTIVDDIGSPSKSGKQFITVTTKNGEYFYIVIDRDDHGERSVHFLSLVDEEDILDVLDPETAKEYKKKMEETQSSASLQSLLPQPETQPETGPETQPKVNENSGKLSMISTIIIVILMGGAGAFYWFTKKRNASNDEDLYDQDEDFDSDEYEG